MFRCEENGIAPGSEDSEWGPGGVGQVLLVVSLGQGPSYLGLRKKDASL